ncbi:CBWD3 [Branchiostoma lanceolatum]|uniref:CBWD3 protein n=1 Tax=Branchiostoma lanceolatum TaxID=7740 RepID=A0A8J9YXG3_BRALA|nr:CBWD3 [Branchiostoma lanceolatum]
MAKANTSFPTPRDETPDRDGSRTDTCAPVRGVGSLGPILRQTPRVLPPPGHPLVVIARACWLEKAFQGLCARMHFARPVRFTPAFKRRRRFSPVLHVSQDSRSAITPVCFGDIGANSFSTSPELVLAGLAFFRGAGVVDPRIRVDRRDRGVCAEGCTVAGTGVLSLRGCPRRCLLQAVHELYDLEETSPWPESETTRRINRLVFIGRNLDHGVLAGRLAQAVK